MNCDSGLHQNKFCYKYISTDVAKHKLQTLLIFGYPLTAEYLGGLIWIRKVADYLEKKGILISGK